jgi:transcription-repair coupling factor (superfamily II helicase)
MIQRLVPNARVGIGHGQMEGKKLEELMLAFMNGEFDVLVATTIIESGLDVPNANTIFINNANNFGLSDLHQMRGRVGRSNKKAFCYFICPPYSAMTDDARKRIQALEQFSDLGSGFNIAMKDLEIRGAGDLLGGEQSGFINEIGFDTYQKIMNEAIEELKENEFKDLYPTENNLETKEYVKTCKSKLILNCCSLMNTSITLAND